MCFYASAQEASFDSSTRMKIDPKSIVIINRTFHVPVAEDSLVRILCEEPLIKSHITEFKKNYQIDKTPSHELALLNCIIDTADFMVNYNSDSYPAKQVVFDNCKFNFDFNLEYSIIGAVGFRGSKFKSLRIKGDDLHLILHDDTIRNGLFIRASKVTLSLRNVKIDNDKEIVIFNSNVNECFIDNKVSNILFTNDTISSDFIVDNYLEEDLGKISMMTLKFEKCYINSPIVIAGESKSNVKIIFEECKFGTSANLIEMNVDTLIFNKCSEFEKPIFLSNSGSVICNLYFQNTDINKIIFNYSNNYHYFIPNEIKDADYGNSFYESLLEKFKIEGKLISYQVVDVSYKQYKYKSSYFGNILNFIDKTWWYYGYAPARVFGWAFLFLVIFFFINSIYWKQINTVYNIIPVDKESWYTNYHFSLKNKIKKQVHILIFTFFIFSTIYINFSKLSFTNTRWLIWFFIQYFVGLFCLFFIFNAILKF